MKSILIIGMLTLISFTACGSSKKSTEKKAITKENLLDGLHPPVGYTLPQNLLSKTTPIYTEDAVEISHDEMVKMTKSGEYSSVPYVNDENVVQLWLVKKMTDQEKAQLNDVVDKQTHVTNLKGSMAKQFSVTDVKGNKFDMNELKGKIVILNFWFIGCKPCIQEMDDLNKLVDKCQNKNVIFIGFALDKKDKVIDFLKRKPFKYNIIADAGNVCDNYGIDVFPANLVVDQNSMITYHTTGLINEAPTDMFAEIERLEKKE